MESAERESQVSTWLNRIDSELDMAGAVQEKIANRISSVLLGQPPTDPETAKKPEEGLVLLANTLRSFAVRLSTMTDEYDSMVERLEL